MKIGSFMIRLFLAILLLFLFTNQDCSHDKNIVTGKVFPAGMTVPVQGVVVQVIGNDTTRIITNGEGFFKIQVSSFPCELRFMKEPYQTQVVTVKKPSDIAVYMRVAKK